jgi:hypothetical protein
MKRRSLLKSIAVAPAAAALPAPLNAQTSSPAATAPVVDSIKVEISPVDVAAQPVARFFTAQQFAALRKLGEVLAPSYNERPGSTEAQAPEFLDFYLSQSAAERQELYRQGLDRLDAEARKRYSKAFSELTEDQIAPLLAPLTEAWTYHGPSDPFARFLVAAKDEVLRATVSSRAYAAAMAQTTRGASGTGYYWFTIE